MSTKEVQKHWGKEILTTSEGIVRTREVEYTLDQWSANFVDYLKSNMSYCNSKNLSEYIGSPLLLSITDNAYKRFNK